MMSGALSYEPFEGDISRLPTNRLLGLERRVEAALKRFDFAAESFERIYRQIQNWARQPNQEVSWVYGSLDSGFYGDWACIMEVAINQVVEFRDQIQYIPAPVELATPVVSEDEIRHTDLELERERRLYFRNVHRIYEGTSRNIRNARYVLSRMQRDIEERWFAIGEG